jgi:WD40 repeat protein/transcriptional regulator with XRE-family HTH domain/energy-coupling factor transporter ATP-binding protein EcfA2
MTQAVLADRAGLSVRAIQHLEAGLGQPYRDTARRLADALVLTDGVRATFESAAAPTPRRRVIAARAFDVFLCHDGHDSLLVEHVAEQLRMGGLEPWVDTSFATDGDERDNAAALRASSSCAVFVGASGVQTWDGGLLGQALGRSRRDRGFRAFPVLLPGVPEPFDGMTLPPSLDRQPWVDLRGGVDDPQALGKLVNTIRGTLPGPVAATGLRDARCPYRGLQFFEEEHAELFFGRSADLQRLLEELKTTRFVAVVGPSGSGKSSLARAGLLPALHAGALPASDGWPAGVLVPGAQPLTNLAAHLLQMSGTGTMQRTLDRLARDARTLHLAASLAMAKLPASARLLVVVDQFEEVFTQCRTEDERAQFVANLLYAAAVPDGRTVVVLTLRADFYHRCAAYSGLAARIGAHQLLLSPLDTWGLRQAIEGPARLVGLRFEPGLVDTILNDVAGEPGALPLLEHALLELWAQRQGDLLTLEGYRVSGGVRGAIAQRAEAVYGGFGPAERVIAQRVLLRLTEPGEGTEDTRRRARLDELVTHEAERETTERVIGALADARLVTTGSDSQSAEGSVEIAHEALIRSWPRLQRWLDEDRAALRVHRQLIEAAREWQRLGGDEDVLYRGSRLVEALDWQEHHEQALNDTERGFLSASVALRARELRVREHQRRAVTLTLSIGLVLAGLLCGLAAMLWRQAEDAHQVAEGQRQLAVARELGFHADAVRKGSAVLLPRSVLLAAEGLRRFSSHETEPALRQGLALLGQPLLTVAGHGQVRSVAFGPSGHDIAAAGAANQADIWDATSGQVVAQLSHEGPVDAVAWSPDGRFLATASDDRGAYLWDPSGHQIARLSHISPVLALAFGPDGRSLATASEDGQVKIWDTESQQPVAQMQHDGPLQRRYSPDGGNEFAESTSGCLDFASDGETVVSGCSIDNTARVWDAASGRELLRLQQDDVVRAVAFGPDDRVVATGGIDGSAHIWALPSGRELGRVAIERGAPVFALAFSPDGRYLAVGGAGSITAVVASPAGPEVASLWNDDIVQSLSWSPDSRYLATGTNDHIARLWEVPSGRELSRMPMASGGPVYAVTFSPDGARLATASDDGSVRVWQAIQPWQESGLSHDDSVIFADFSPGGRLLATSSGNFVYLWDAMTGRELRRLSHPAVAWAIHFSSDLRYLATSSFDGNARIWDITTGTEVARFHHGDNERIFGVRFSPDGQKLATAGREGVVRVWDVASGQQLLQVAHDAAAGYPRFTPDGRYLVTGSVDRTARVWDLATGQEVRRFVHDYPLYDLAISSDGRLLAGGDDQTARVWELATGREVLHLPHDSEVNGVAFSPDGRYLATAARNGVARVWDVATGQQVGGMAHDKPLNGLAFSPDGTWLATASNDHTVRLWTPVLADPVAEACRRVMRNLTPDEWREYLAPEPYRQTCPAVP